MLFNFRSTHAYKTINIDGNKWRYISCGKGDKAIFLLPGGFATADLWFYLISTLEDEYRIIAPDSYSLQGTWGLDNVCKAIIAIMNAENVVKATFLGISAGAAFPSTSYRNTRKRSKTSYYLIAGSSEG